MVFHPSIFMDIESLDVEKGVMNSGIFQRICRECDGRFFQDYENERNLQKKLSLRPIMVILKKVSTMQ